jgi:hypothetical protein
LTTRETLYELADLISARADTGVTVVVAPCGEGECGEIVVDEPREAHRLVLGLRLAGNMIRQEPEFDSGSPAPIPGAPTPARLLINPAWLSGEEADAETLYRAAQRLLVAQVGTALRSAGAYLLWAAAALGSRDAAARLATERQRWSERDARHE